jgi:predicted DsbA family dithiol-disulfide isomerase
MKQIIKIDVVSDIVCPWCYIGKRRLERALETLENTFEFGIEYHPFELNPNHPVTGVDNRNFLISKFGSEDRYQALTDHVSSIAAQEELTFNYDLQKNLPNTRKAHALVQLAGTEGVQRVLVELLFKAYFTEGTDLSNHDTLIELAEEAGIDREKAEQYLRDESSLLQVALAEQQMYKLGISGVPFFIINNKYGISGAQTPDIFIKAFQDITTEKSPVS